MERFGGCKGVDSTIVGKVIIIDRLYLVFNTAFLDDFRCVPRPWDFSIFGREAFSSQIEESWKKTVVYLFRSTRARSIFVRVLFDGRGGAESI